VRGLEIPRLPPEGAASVPEPHAESATTNAVFAPPVPSSSSRFRDDHRRIHQIPPACGRFHRNGTARALTFPTLYANH